jgi:tight adherence protein B
VGHSFPQAIGSVIERVRPPLRDELKIVRGNLTLGLSSEDALLKFHKRLPCEETMILYLAISSSLKRGGNIFEILPIVKESIESKLQAEARVRALTSQGRMQGLTLSIVPPLLFAAFNVVVPGYLHSLYSTTPGKWILVISSLLMALAWISIYIITRPEV